MLRSQTHALALAPFAARHADQISPLANFLHCGVGQRVVPPLGIVGDRLRPQLVRDEVQFEATDVAGALPFLSSARKRFFVPKLEMHIRDVAAKYEQVAVVAGDCFRIGAGDDRGRERRLQLGGDLRPGEEALALVLVEDDRAEVVLRTLHQPPARKVVLNLLQLGGTDNHGLVAVFVFKKHAHLVVVEQDLVLEAVAVRVEPFQRRRLSAVDREQVNVLDEHGGLLRPIRLPDVRKIVPVHAHATPTVAGLKVAVLVRELAVRVDDDHAVGAHRLDHDNVRLDPPKF